MVSGCNKNKERKRILAIKLSCRIRGVRNTRSQSRLSASSDGILQSLIAEKYLPFQFSSL